ncbi:lysylphosphatidylglycerol synthase domain-containing protein [Lewinella sp. IMCC34191]|uniref:lysylphosphatidylglycerol synthase domain-containing protein n=1 Tax=Lewinella sp. IMCC34191 TaxID=2259172 RepID=UPI000E27C35F|nr:lysylphosphatidylglycerol synthase domain-containing protein [Lewinella sp. IMCC34191]
MVRSSRFLPSPAVRTWLLRILTVAVLAVFIYQFQKVAGQIDWPHFWRSLTRPGNWRYLALVAVLMPVNWLLETRKWQLLLRAFLDWPFAKVFRATLAGVSVSAATPNRIGEIGGRMLLAHREEWPAVVASSILGSLCQWVAFLLLAWPALVITVGRLPQIDIGVSYGWFLPIGPLLLLVAAIGGKPLLLRVVDWSEGRFVRDATTLRESLTKVKLSLMSRSSIYATLRFVVYCVQLYVLLRFFGLALPFLGGMAGIMAIYLVQAGIPLPPGLNLVTRTELGLLLWSVGPEGSIAVLAAYTALFCVNVLLPAVPGYWLIVRKNYSR